MKIMSGILLVCVVAGLYSCGNAFNKSDSSGKNASAHMSEVSLGMSKSEVISVLGKPEDGQNFSSTYGDSSCIYYGTLSTNDWQLCFDNGRLTSKNHY